MTENSDREYVFYTPDVNSAFRCNNLWLPKSKIDTSTWKSCLEFDTGDDGKMRLWRESKSHLIVPRMAVDIGSFDFPVRDEAVRFEPVKFISQIQIRPDQEAAWNALKSVENGVLVMATGKGKTVLGLQKIVEVGGPAIVVVNEGGLLDQWCSQIRDLLGVSPGVVQGNKSQWGRPVVVAMVQTLCKRLENIPQKIRQRFALAIYDECHCMASKEFSKTLDLFYGSRIGLTATPARPDGTEVIYFAHLGKVFFSDTKPPTAPTYNFQQLRTQAVIGKECYDKIGELNVSKLRDMLCSVKGRCEEIASHVKASLAAGRKTLVLCHSKKEVSHLAEILKCSAVITGDTRSDTRLDIFRGSQLVIATAQVAAQALDAPEISSVFFVSPFKSERILIQGSGRSTRIYEGKQEPVVTILYHHNIAVCCSMARSVMTTVRNSGYKVNILRPPT